jgi:hypothetical protein
MRRSVLINTGATALLRSFSVLNGNSRREVFISSSIVTSRVSNGLVLRKIFPIRFKPLRSSSDARGGR